MESMRTNYFRLPGRSWSAGSRRVDPVLQRPLQAARVITASNPAEGILSFARENECDLIVLSATGASLVRAILVGANARKVVRASACPVLVIPASNRVAVDSVLERASGGSRAEPSAAPEARGDWARAR